MAANGQPCSVGAECTTGSCLVGFCQPTGFPISIDATALSNKGLVITGYSTTPIDTNQARTVNLAAGTYTLQPYTGLNSIATFTVDSSGRIQYDPALEGLLNGANSTSLKVNGRTITVDARPLAQPQLALLAYHYQAGAEVDQLPLSNSAPVSFTLLPLVDFGYQFDVDGNHLAGFTFNLDPSGNVLVPADELMLAAGSGGTLLRLGGAHITVTVPTGLGNGVLGGDITIPEGTTTNLQVLPYASGASMSLSIGGQTSTLTVSSAGYLDGDPLLLHVLQVQGDGLPLCAAENTQAEASGWDLTPINSCGGASPQTGTGYIDAATINPTVTSRITGAGRSPAMLPRHRRPAGGDPVLGDGEFLIDRTDASLAGLGIHYEFHRSYRSGNENDGPLSPGWDHNYDQRILGQVIGNTTSPDFDPIVFGDEIGANCDGTVQYQDGEGNVLLFTHQSWGFDTGGFVESFVGPSPDLTLELHLSVVAPLSTTWHLIRNDGQVTTFDRAGFLSSITDPAGNSLTFGWLRATPPAPPQGVDCPAIGYSTKECTNWLYGLTKTPIGQRRRLMFVKDVARTVYYVYSQTNTELIYPNDRLACISLSNDCTNQVLASFGYSDGRLTTVMHGPPTVTAFETYHYHDPVSDVPYCRPSAELPGYCHRLCDDPVQGQCDNLGYSTSVQYRCANTQCGASQCDDPNAFPIRRGTAVNAPSICCVSQSPGDDSCAQFLWNGPNCLDGCENEYQCSSLEGDPQFQLRVAAYAGGIEAELANDITEIDDSKGNLVVSNVYGEDRRLVSFEKVVSQTLGSSSTDNTITFQYHDLNIEAHGAPIYNNTNGEFPWDGQYSSPDPTVNQYSRFTTKLDICPTTCPGGGSVCATFDYSRPVEYVAGFEEQGSRPTVFATVIHDLHGRNRIQYLDQDFYVMKEVALDTGEVTEFNYTGGGIVRGGLLRGVLAASGVRTCLERDAAGRVTQSSVVAAPGYSGQNMTQATTYSYYPTGQLSDEVHDVFGQQPTHTHYERDALSRVKWIDQDVSFGATPERTTFGYDEVPLPTGISGVIETPTSITYPNLRKDTFSDFDRSLAGPQTIVIDSTNTSSPPEQRRKVYDSFGRVMLEEEVNRFATHYLYEDPMDMWRLSRTGHRLDISQPWIDTTIDSHVVDDETITDSITEFRDSTTDPLRTTTLNNTGRFPTQKRVDASWAPSGHSLPDSQTTCYNYSADGRLEEVILPEGNGLIYQYSYDTSGATVTVQKGFIPSTTAAWAAGCQGHTAPSGDPAMGTISSRTTLPGGFILSDSSDGLSSRQYVTDGFGRAIQITSSTGLVPVQQFGYDTKGNRIWEATLTAAGAISSSNPYHQPSLTDSHLLSWTDYTYDLKGRVRIQTAHVLETGETLVRQTDYDDVNNTVTVTDRGSSTVTKYDGRNRVTSTTLPDNSVRSVQHFLGGDIVTTKTNSQGNIRRTYNYDTRNLLLNVQDDQAATLYQATYDPIDGKQLTETRAGQGQVTWTYDAFRRLIQDDKVLNSTETATSTYQYDRNNRMTVYQDAKNVGHPWQMTYTSADAPLTVIDPEGRGGTYVYAAANHAEWPRTLLGSMTEPNGRSTSYAYDAQARLVDVYNGLCPQSRAVGDCDGVLMSQRHLTYDAHGYVSQIADPTGTRATVQQTYDSLGRLTEEDVGVDSTVQHQFADAGRTRMTTISFAGQTATTRHAFDKMGRLIAVDLEGGDSLFHNLATYKFGTEADGTNGIGGPLSLTYANGATAKYSYDGKLRQTGIDVYFGGDADSNIVASVHEAFGVDSIPRMRQRKVGTQTWSDLFEVDLDGRVIKENLRVSGLTLPNGEIANGDVDSHIGDGSNWGTYDLDKISNIVQVTTANSTLVHEVNRISKLTKIGNSAIDSDPRDNLTTEEGSPQVFAFDDFWGTVTCIGASGSCPAGGVGASTFEYDALNRRRLEHRSDGDRVYIWDGKQLVGHGTTVNLSLDVPGSDIDAHIVSIDGFGTGSQWFYHQGRDQSVVAVTGSEGLVEAYSYSAFGELTIWDQNGNVRSPLPSVFGNLFQFQGQVYDDVTSTYSMRAREYHPAWGTFVSPDALGTLGGPSQYAFAGSRPLAARDPLGLLPDNAKFAREWMASWDAPFAAPWAPVMDLLESGIPDLYSQAKDGFYYDEYGQLHHQAYLGGWWDPEGTTSSRQLPQGFVPVSYIQHYRDTIVEGGDLISFGGAPPSAAPVERYASFDAALAAAGQRYRLRMEYEADPLHLGAFFHSLNKELLEPLVLAPFLMGGVKLVQTAEEVAEGASTLSSSAIRFSQSSVNGVAEIAESMAANGWVGAPIDVVQIGDALVTVDNTRLLAAHMSDTPVQAIIHDAGEALPESMAGRFGDATTWGDAVMNRIAGQNTGYQSAYPNGSWITGWGGR